MPSDEEVNTDKIKKARRLDDVYHHTLNDHQKQLEKTDQGNEYTRVNHRSEGRCYVCHDSDVVQPTVIDACYGCIGKYGDWTDSGLYTFCQEKPELFCHLCGKWKMGGANINVKLCLKCHKKNAQRLNAYTGNNGMYSNPFYKYMRKRKGKEWFALEMEELNDKLLGKTRFKLN